MHPGHLTDNVLTTRSINATAAGSTNINGTSVDTSIVPCDAVRAVALIGALTATQVTALKLQESDDDVTYTDIANSQTGNMADGDGNKLLISDKIKFAKRYVRPVLLRATANAVVDGVILEFYRLRTQKVTQHANVSKSAVA